MKKVTFTATVSDGLDYDLMDALDLMVEEMRYGLDPGQEIFETETVVEDVEIPPC